MNKLKPFAMPKWGIEMSEGTLAQWQVKEGIPFSRGSVIALIETDKITNEVEAEADGCLVRLIAQEQETYPVGALIGVMGPSDTNAAEIDAFIDSYNGIASNNEPLSQPDTLVETPAASLPFASKISADVAISPAARRAAEANGIDLTSVSPSGRNGRFTRQDIDKTMNGTNKSNLKGLIDLPGQESAFASPLARRLAVLHQIDMSQISGTGPRGRICKADILSRINQHKTAGSETGFVPSNKVESSAKAEHDTEYKVIPMTTMRQTIARRLTEAKQTIPHIYLRRAVRADRLFALREAAGKVASINDYIIRACALALSEIPVVNIQVHDREIHQFNHADISIAVATDRGLLTPILRSADTKDLVTISAEARSLAQRARAGKLKTEDIQGGSFTISNLGSYGVHEFDAVINPPQGAILAVGSAHFEPFADDNAIRIVPVFHMSLSCDHRAIDGVDGARFLEALAELIENPALL